jgi:type I restriction-modification system DNA methylase subunit
MSLYQASVLKNYINLQEKQIVEKAYKKYTTYFLDAAIQENIRNSKEEEYQGIFLTELFVNILDYTLKPKADFNLVAEYKNQNNARKADGAILQNDIAVGVIELKGTNTKDLESIRKQAFDYKANQKGCVYVITSNFEKLRFYINDATEFEEFNLFELSIERFALLFLCLQKDNILNNVPLKIKEASIVKEEQITKEFYKDYSLFKRELYRDLVKNNVKRLKLVSSLRGTKQSLDDLSEEQKTEQQQLDKNVKLTLFKKSQKLIDRFLFIFFAEDRSLLPANSTELILQKWKADIDFGDERPLYNLFKQYFHFLDQGRQGTKSRGEIYAYNGGLFKEDTLLDGLEIDNDLLYKHTHKLAGYDFESQVDVNILGHIFENSLNEIESVNAEIEGADFDKQTSKRKKDGVFYTPKYITKYIVENTIGKLCTEKKTDLGIKEEEYFKGRKNRNKATIANLVDLLDTYRDWLLQLTICDPACGSGAFLNQALNFLIAEHTYIDELKTKVLGGGLQFSDIENTILENNIFGVDLNEESVEIAKLSLWLRTAQPRRKLNDLSSNIKCGNSLIDSKAVAGDKAFHWVTQFPQVFEKGGFDVVIGNPPYGAGFNNNEKIYLRNEYSEIHTRTPESFNYFVYKIEKIIKHKIAEWGIIIPSSFLNQHEFEKTRKYLLEKSNINKVLNLGDSVFQDVATPTCILVVSKQEGTIAGFADLQKIKRHELVSKIFEKTTLVNADEFEKNIGYSFIAKNNKNLIDKCYQNKTLKEVVEEVATGISPGLGNAFVKTKEEIVRLKLEPELLRKLIIGGEINRYFLDPTSTKQIIYATNKTQIENYPNIYKELSNYREKLDKRAETATGRIPWFVMLRPRREKLFIKEKILIRQTASKILASYDDKQWHCLKSGIIIQLSDKSIVSYNYLIAILNSKLMDFLYQDLVGEGGRIFPEVKPINLFKLPIKIINNNNKSIDLKVLESLVDIMQNQNNLVVISYNKFQNYLKQKFQLEKLSKKLENWHELEFGDFTKELNKSIKKEGGVLLTKKDEFEWLDLFEENKQKAQTLQTQITQTDKEIDAMVYELYGLTEDEIKIVENS